MRSDRALETSFSYRQLMRLIAREDFIEFIRHESFRSYFILKKIYVRLWADFHLPWLGSSNSPEGIRWEAFRLHKGMEFFDRLGNHHLSRIIVYHVACCFHLPPPGIVECKIPHFRCEYWYRFILDYRMIVKMKMITGLEPETIYTECWTLTPPPSLDSMCSSEMRLKISIVTL
jgi:hypothetical protein